MYGPDLTPAVLAAAAEAGVPVGFYGGSQEVLERLLQRVTREFPNLNIAYGESPPFRPPTPEEDCPNYRRHSSFLASDLLFLGLNTPKQDRWMCARWKRVQAVMLGVGAPRSTSWQERRCKHHAGCNATVWSGCSVF